MDERKDLMRKYKKGREIISFKGLRYYLKRDGVVYLRDKVQNREWVISAQLRYLMGLMDKGLISTALKKQLTGGA